MIGLMVNPRNPQTDDQLREVREAARSIGQQILVLNAGSEGEIEASFVALVEKHGLLIGADVLLASQSARIAVLAARHAIPTIALSREYAVVGGLMSYGTSVTDAYRQAGVYAGRVLKGEKPADLPITQPTKFELVINLKTAKALSIEIPPPLLARADEVIE
jgi:putative ABC transport system substrate-binding protein